jgi:hypothetical protein
MPSYINGIDASLIIGLGQIGVGGGSPPTPTTYPSGGLVVNSGDLRPDLAIRSGIAPATGSNYFYSRPGRMDSASLGTSNWTKIVSNDQATFFLSSSGELYAMGGANSSIYTGTGKSDTLAKVTTGSNWTDIAAGLQFAIGICDGKLFGIGTNGNGQFGRGNTTNNLSNFGVINGNTFWTKVSCGNAFTMAISGSGGSGSIFSAGSNSSGRTGQNTTVGNTLTFTQPVGFTGSIFTDVSCGEDFALAISGGNIYGTGESGDRQLGINNTTDRTTFGLASGSGIFTKVFAFTDFSKAIDINGQHYHTGDESNTRGDGNSFTAITSWTRLNTSGEFASGWQNFYSYHLGGTSYGVIGVKSNRPFFIGTAASYTGYMPNTTWTNYINTATSTWTAFVSTSINVSCSAAAFSPGWNNILDPILFINLTPTL